MSKMKQVMTGLLVVTMAVTGMLSILVTTNAAEAETMPETIYYDDTLQIGNYWTKAEKEVPVKEGYVFGGWYTSEDEVTYTALKEADIDTDGDGVADITKATYAKFVPAYILSVKSQIDIDTQNAGQASGTDGKAFLRVISAVDSTKYEQVGFDLFYDKTHEETEDTVITKVYKKITNDETGEEGWKPTNVFGPSANYFSIMKINGISNDNCDNILYVRPYWVTLDGTRVEGLSKYVRVMDGYTSNQYISVPINLLTGGAVAAGKMEMTYDYKTLNYVGFDSGVLLPEMNVNVDESTGTIRFVGNTTVGENNAYTDVESESDIYVNVWFQKKSAEEIETAGGTVPEFWSFVMSEESFCNWAETMVTDVKAWDVRY